MKKRWLNVFAGLSLFLMPQKAQGKEPEVKQEEKQLVQMNVMPQLKYGLTYTQEEINAKLDKLYKKIEGSPEWKEYTKKILQEMSQYDIGLRTIMQMPENVKN